MYRLFLCILLAQLATCHRYRGEHHSHCNRQHHDYKKIRNANNDFYELSWDVVRFDRKSHRMCDATRNTTETYFANLYKLSVPLSEFEDENISVKLRHRVLFIEAYKASEKKLFNDLRILPEFLKFSDASWMFSDGILDVNIPYKFTVGQERVKPCDEVIDESEIVVPKMDIDVRFGTADEATTTSSPSISSNVV